MDWTVRGSNAGEGEIFLALQTGFEAHPASFTWVTGLFPERGVDRLRPSSSDLRIGSNCTYFSPVCLLWYVMG